MSKLTVGEIDGFIDMLRAACDNKEINQSLQKILSLPNPDRREMVRNLVAELTNKNAPSDLLEAIACLVSDDVSKKAHDVIYKCSQ